MKVKMPEFDVKNMIANHLADIYIATDLNEKNRAIGRFCSNFRCRYRLNLADFQSFIKCLCDNNSNAENTDDADFRG